MEETRHGRSEGLAFAQGLTPDVTSETSLRRQLVAAWDEIKDLRRTVAHQARLLENLHSETHPAAPSLNCVYWLFSLAHETNKSWKEHRNRLLPSLRGMGTMLAPDITPIAWARHLAERKKEEQRGGGTPSAQTLNIELARLKGMLYWAVRNELITHNPLEAAEYLKTKSRRETELRHYDIETMLAAAEDVADRRLPDGEDDGLRSKKLTAFILLCFDSMLRFTEARTLKRAQIEPDGTCRVVGKGDKLRTVKLTERTLEAIQRIPEHPCGHVFANHESGEVHGEQTIRGWFRWACEHGRLDAKAAPRDRRIVPHHMRHAGATEADAGGASANALRLALGHESLKTTERYLHRSGIEAAHHVGEIMERRPPRRSKADSKKSKHDR